MPFEEIKLGTTHSIIILLGNPKYLWNLTLEDRSDQKDVIKEKTCNKITYTYVIRTYLLYNLC